MRGALLLLLPLLGLLASGPAVAQDVRALVDRLDRLQRDVDTLQRQVYRGQAPPPSSPSAAPSAPAGEGLPVAAINRFETRISQLEETLRELTGKIEEISYANEQTRRQLEKLAGDVDVRFQQLEQGRGAPPQAAAPTAPASQQASAPAAASQSGTLGSMTQTQLQANAPVPPAAATPAGGAPARPAASPQQAARPPAAAILPDGSPEDQYKFAFNILLQNDYDQAERAFRAYIDKHPNDARTENARYWLAETYYVRDKFEPASTAFAEAYQKAPNGQKAPDNLLKLGMSLGRLNKPREACATFDRLAQQFPNAAGTIKSRAQAEKQRLNCR
jgi:tol-pal system protein YbgF